MRRGVLTLLLAPLALAAQMPPPATLQALAQTTWRAVPYVLVLPGAGSSLKQDLQKVLSAEGPLELGLDLKAATAASHPALVKALAGMGLTAPGWALVDPGGRILVQGTRAPSPEDLCLAARGAGVHPRTEVLETFLKTHPDHAQALQELLLTRLQLAERRAARLPSAPAAPGTPAGEAPLSGPVDAAIWGPCARVLTAYFAERAETFDATSLALAFPAQARRSPLMREAARKALPLLEEEMLRSPRLWTYWTMWRAMNRWLETPRPAQALLQAAPPLPGGRPYLPAEAVRAFNDEALAAGDWPGLAAFLQPVLDANLDRGVIRRVQEDTPLGTYLARESWDEFGPLVEAYLRLGNDRKATETVEALVAGSALGSLARKAADLAARLQRPDLARQWAGIQAPKVDPGATLTLGRSPGTGTR